MNYIFEGIKEGWSLIISCDPEVYKVILLSLYVSLTAVILATLISVPLGMVTGLHDFKGRRVYSRIVNTLMGMPPVVMGLIVFMMVSRKGPLGSWQLWYTPTAMIIAQTLLILPIILGNVFNHVKRQGTEIRQSLKTLGAGKVYGLWVLIKELKGYIAIAVVTGFGRAISEVGAVMLVGGNIKGETRTMTTFIAMNNNMGNYSQSIAMAMILLLLAFLMNSLLHYFVERRGYDSNRQA